MTTKVLKLSLDSVRPDDVIHTGPRGGEYIIRDGIKYYINRKPIPYGRTYKPKAGAFQRFLTNQN